MSENKLTYGSDIVSAIQNLKRADHHFTSFQSDYPGSKGADLFKQYKKKIDFIFKDFVSVPFFRDEIRAAIRNEINADVFAPIAIQEKIALLPPEKREFAENVIDCLLQDKEIEVQLMKSQKEEAY